MLHTSNPCNNSCNTPFSTISGHHPSPLRSRRSRPTPPPLSGDPPDPLRRCPGITAAPDPGSRVRSRVRRPPRRRRLLPRRILFPRNGTWNRPGAMWMVGRCPRPAVGVKCLRIKGKGVCEEMGRRLPLRGLPDGPALHEDPPEQGALHHSSSS